MIPLLLALAAVIMQDVETLRKAGNELLDRDDYKGALLKFEKALAAASDRPELFVGRARALGGLKLYEDAEKDLNRALELDPTMALAYYLRGKGRYLQGLLSAALTDFDLSLERGLRDPQIFIWKGNTLNKQVRCAEAEPQFSRALAEGGPSAAAYSGRAWARFSQGNLREAISDETRSIDLDPVDPADYTRRAMAYYGKESWDNALGDLRKAVELEKNLSEFKAHWIFLCRCRLGQREAAVQELRAFLKDTSRTSSWEFNLLAFDVGDVGEDKLLQAATEKHLLAAAHLAIATRQILDGKAATALEHFRKAAQIPLEGNLSVGLARAELQRQVRLKLDPLMEELEAKIRKLTLFEAVYELDMPSIPGDELAIRSIVWTADMSRAESSLIITKSDAKLKSVKKLSLQMKEAQFFVWESGEDYQRLDMSFAPKLIEQLNLELAGIVGPPPGGKVEPFPGTSLGLQLEGKPSKDGEGMFRFFLGFTTSPASWLTEVPGPDDVVREGTEEIVFEFPSRRKKVVIDRRNGLLKLLETLDYDGTTRRSLRLVSYKPVEVWQKLNRPEKELPSPAELAQFKNLFRQQESILHDQAATLVERWEKVVAAKKEDQATAILTRWAAQYADAMYSYAVRTLAGRRIKEAMERGTPASALLQNQDAESRRFAEQFAGERKSAEEFIESQLAELAERTENGLYERPIDSRLHAAARALVKKAFDPRTVERRRHATFGDRLEELFREELRARTRI